METTVASFHPLHIRRRSCIRRGRRIVNSQHLMPLKRQTKRPQTPLNFAKPLIPLETVCSILNFSGGKMGHFRAKSRKIEQNRAQKNPNYDPNGVRCEPKTKLGSTGFSTGRAIGCGQQGVVSAVEGTSPGRCGIIPHCGRVDTPHRTVSRHTRLFSKSFSAVEDASPPVVDVLGGRMYQPPLGCLPEPVHGERDHARADECGAAAAVEPLVGA